MPSEKLTELQGQAMFLRQRINELRIDYPEAANVRRDDLAGVEAEIDTLKKAEKAPAALTAQPAEARVTVKALEWDDRWNENRSTSGRSKRLIMERALTAFGAYFIEHSRDDDTWWLTDRLLGDEIAGPLGEPWEARAAAQADYEARIRSALVPQWMDTAVEAAQDAWIKTRLKSAGNHKTAMRAAITAAYPHMTGAAQEAEEAWRQFKNFHRLLCERFEYSHDEKDWRRDQVSLIEWIARRLATPQSAPSSADALKAQGINAGMLSAAEIARGYGHCGYGCSEAIAEDIITVAEATRTKGVEVEYSFTLEWIAAPRPPIHPTPMTGRQSFRTFDKAVGFMRGCAPDAKFVSLTEYETHTIDRSSEARAMLPAPKQGGE